MGQREISRREFMAIIGGAVCIAAGLTSCSNAGAQAPAQVPFEITPAFGDEFGIVTDAMTQEAEDAVFVAARLSTTVSSEVACSWSYLFGSAQEAAAWTVFTDAGQAYPAYYGDYSLTEEEASQVPSADEVHYDADASFALAVEALDGEQVDSCYAYILARVDGDDAGYKPMTWYFEINSQAEASAALATEDAAAGEEDSSAEGASESDSRNASAEDNEAEAQAAGGIVVSVDARTGEVALLRL